MTDSPTLHQRVTPRQIADLLAQARHLSQAGPGADPATRIAYLRAKADLLAALTDPNSHHPADHHPADHEPEEQR